ncbi:CRE-UNC-93 protein [Aphelenchoides avenae]|nr:CRE-UNC-93 protein [Aphelenchus avenae]
MRNIVSSLDEVDEAQIQAYIAKAIRKKKRANLTGEERERVDREKHKIRMNLWIISIAFLFLFTGFNSLQNLQTTVNAELGGDGLFTLYASLAVSSLFVPSFVVNRLGCKMTLVVAIGIHILYMIAHFLPRYYSLIPASILAGIGQSCLWAANCLYITESGIKYARLNIEAQNVVIVRMFGYFFMVVHMGQVMGNLISSLVLVAFVPTIEIEDKVDPTCGHGFPSNSSLLSQNAQLNLQRPPVSAYAAVVGIDLVCALIALMFVGCFLNSLKRDEIERSKEPQFTTEVLRLTAKNLKKPKPLLLIPLTIFNGIEQAFAVGLYTKAYVACGLGVGHVGFVMTSFGVADAVCSLVFGPLIKLFGRMPLFVFGAVINGLMIMTLAIWPLNPGDRALFNAIAGVWGMADGVWNTQVNGLWVALVGRDSLEVAFANYRFWMSSGLAIGFLLMRFTTIYQFLSISFIVLLLGFLGYFMVELYDSFMDFIRRTLASKDDDDSRLSVEEDDYYPQGLVVPKNSVATRLSDHTGIRKESRMDNRKESRVEDRKISRRENNL